MYDGQLQVPNSEGITTASALPLDPQSSTPIDQDAFPGDLP